MRPSPASPSSAEPSFARYVEPIAFADDDLRPPSAAPLDALADVVDRSLAQAARLERAVVDTTLLVHGAVAGTPALAVGDDLLGLDPIDLAGALRERSARFAELAALAGDGDGTRTASLLPSASAQAVAEAAGHRPDEVLLHLTGDTQIASSIVIAGVPFHGAHGLAGTFGHLPIVPNGVRCDCGQRGCLATVASPAVVLEKAGLDEVDRRHGRREALDELLARIGESEDRARWAWHDAALWIGRALQVVVPVVDPAVVTVGGYWGRLVDDIDTALRDNRPSFGGGALASIPRIVPASAGPDAELAGARLAARERLRAGLVAAAGRPSVVHAHPQE